MARETQSTKTDWLHFHFKIMKLQQQSPQCSQAILTDYYTIHSPTPTHIIAWLALFPQTSNKVSLHTHSQLMGKRPSEENFHKLSPLHLLTYKWLSPYRAFSLPSLFLWMISPFSCLRPIPSLCALDSIYSYPLERKVPAILFSYILHFPLYISIHWHMWEDINMLHFPS